MIFKCDCLRRYTLRPRSSPIRQVPRLILSVAAHVLYRINQWSRSPQRDASPLFSSSEEDSRSPSRPCPRPIRPPRPLQLLPRHRPPFLPARPTSPPISPKFPLRRANSKSPPTTPASTRFF